MTVVSDVTYTLSAGVPAELSLPALAAAHASVSWLVYSPGEDLEFLEEADSDGAILVPAASGIQKVGPFKTKVGLPRFVQAAGNTTVRIIGIRDESSTTVTVGPQPEGGEVVDLGVNVVESLSDFPSPVGGVITLPVGSSWLITDDVDLGTNRLECAGALGFAGLSPETCILRGSHTANPLLTVEGNFTMRDMAMNVPASGTGVRVDGSGGGAAVDWFGVNFTGSGLACELNEVTNAIMGLMGFLGPDAIDVSGNIDTLALTESIVVVTGSGQTGINLNPGAMVNRRLRVGDCAFVVGSGATGIQATPSEIALTEAFILNWVNFSGSGTYINGTTFDDESARWADCRGIQNTARAAALFSTGNAVPTTVLVQGDYVKAVNTTTANSLNQRFTHTDNRLTYTSAFGTTFKVEAVISAFAGSNRIIGLQVFKNGVALDGPAGLGTSSGNLAAERAQNIVYSNIVELAQNDYLEVFVTCLNNLSNVTVVELSLVVSEL